MSEIKSLSTEPLSVKEPSEFAILLRKRRKDLKLSQSDLAGLCGIGTEALSRIERGAAVPGLDTAIRLIEMLNGKVAVTWEGIR